MSAHARAHARNNAARSEHRGRRVGAVAGTYIGTLAEQGTAIVLCWACAPKFNPKAYHYFREGNQPVNGACDGCRKPGVNRTLFLHESLIGVTWTPR